MDKFVNLIRRTFRANPVEDHVARLMKRGAKLYTKHALGLLSREAFVKQLDADIRDAKKRGFYAKRSKK